MLHGVTRMKRTLWMMAGILMVGISWGAAAQPARGDEWSKTYKVRGHANLRVETDDGDVNILAGAPGQIEARVTTDSFKIGPGGVRVEEHQEGDRVTVRVTLPHLN